jgi:hypothetical protein
MSCDVSRLDSTLKSNSTVVNEMLSQDTRSQGQVVVLARLSLGLGLAAGGLSSEYMLGLGWGQVQD